MPRFLLPLTCLLLTSYLLADEIPVVKQEVRIAPGETQRFEFGTVPQKDTTVLLNVFSRLDSPGLGGSMYFMKLVLNGHAVQAAKSRTVMRLINRPAVSPIAAGLPYSWFGSDAWRVLYAQDFQAALAQGFYVGNPYELVLDVTDLTNPAAENRLEITNTAGPDIPRITKTKAELVIHSLTIQTKPGASPTMASGTADRDVINRGTPGAGPAKYTGEITPGGGIALTVDGRRYDVSTAISYPNAGLNRLTAGSRPDGSGQQGWVVRASGGQVIGEGPDYRVVRNVRFTPRKIEVSDAITNLHRDAKLGLIVRNDLSLKSPAGQPSPVVRLAGNPDPAISEYYSNANPSVYAAIPGARQVGGDGSVGIGMICEDDVFRNQARLFFDADTESMGLRTDMLCLPEGGSYALRWSIYPVASGDYYDFINLVRQDWGANYTVEGAWTFFDPDTILATPIEKLKAQFERLGIKVACYCGGWVDRKHDVKKIGFGTGVMNPYWADFRDRLRRSADRIREAVPGCKVLVYYDTQRDTSDGGHERFRDSWLTDPNGNQYQTDWSGVYSLTYSVVATLGDTFGKAMLGVLDKYFDELKSDGPYWDEMECVSYGEPLTTYNLLDGHSCILDPKTYTIRREVGVTTLLGEGHRLAVIDRARARGGMLMGNGPCTTRAMLQRHVQRMVEIQHNETWNYEGNLDSPLGYAGSRPDFGNWVRAIKLATLLVGTQYGYASNFSRYVFPFTPIELHCGYLLGKERIITINSGDYGWPGEKCRVTVRHFDKDGKQTGRQFPSREVRRTDGVTETRTRIDLAEGEAAILTRVL